MTRCDDTPEILARELDAIHFRILKLAEREGGSYGAEIRDVGGYLTDCVGDLLFVAKRQAEREERDDPEVQRDRELDRRHNETLRYPGM